VPILFAITQNISLAKSVPILFVITQNDSIAITVPKKYYITQIKLPTGADKNCPDKSCPFCCTDRLNGSYYRCRMDRHSIFFFGGRMAKHENNYFTDEEWFTIDWALDALVMDLRESADPEFSVSLEKVVLTYDLDECMKEELIRQYDWLVW
jgi:hypothetical protein